jgi:hypothetical protein
VDDRYVATEAFLPDVRTGARRSDQGLETSVNWEDNPAVEVLTLNARATSEHGLARIKVADIYASSRGAPTAPLLCERQPVEGNAHHGNIVFPGHVPKLLLTQLAAALALKSQLLQRPTGN